MYIHEVAWEYVVSMGYVSKPDPPCISAVQMLIWPISEQGLLAYTNMQLFVKGEKVSTVYSNWITMCLSA